MADNSFSDISLVGIKVSEKIALGLESYSSSKMLVALKNKAIRECANSPKQFIKGCEGMAITKDTWMLMSCTINLVETYGLNHPEGSLLKCIKRKTLALKKLKQLSVALYESEQKLSVKTKGCFIDAQIMIEGRKADDKLFHIVMSEVDKAIKSLDQNNFKLLNNWPARYIFTLAPADFEKAYSCVSNSFD